MKMLLHFTSFSGSGALLFTVKGCSSLLFTLLASSPVHSQILPGYAPTQPQVGAGSSNFNIESGMQCPVTTFYVAGFGGNLNTWADAYYSQRQSVSAGTGNYGIAAGLSIPLGRDLSDFCKKYAKARIDLQKSQLQDQLINSQFALYKHCQYFRNYGYDLTEKAFTDPSSPLSVFKDCSSLSELLHPKSRRFPIRYYEDIPAPKPAPTAPENSPKDVIDVTPKGSQR